jgi:hypothetical protein
MQKFGKTKSRIVKSQATVRMWLAVRRLKLLSQEVSFALRRYYGDLGCNYVTAVGRSSCESRIASLVLFSTKPNHLISFSDVTLSQPMIRLQQQMAACTDIQTNWGVFAAKKCRLESKHRGRYEREGNQRMKASAVTKLASAWRRFYYQTTYKRTVRCKCCFLQPHKFTTRICLQPFFISRCDYLPVDCQARLSSKES